MINNISLNLNEIVHQTREWEQKYSRPLGSVSVLAVSKSQPIDLIKMLANEGQTAFGENYVQEALPKIQVLEDQRLTWHYIGRIQSKKASILAKHFDWIHTVTREEEAKALSSFRTDEQPTLNLCIQIKLDNNPSKSGILPKDAFALIESIAPLPKLRLRGLMTIPPFTEDFHAQRKFFSTLRQLKENLQDRGVMLDTLSMGMTHDFEAAIAEGATIIRIGTGIFGPRPI